MVKNAESNFGNLLEVPQKLAVVAFCIALIASCSKLPTEAATSNSSTQSEVNILSADIGTDTGYIKAENAKLYFQMAGQGPALILVHGSAGNSDLWQQQISAFAASGFQVIAFDLRNAGRSISVPGYEADGNIADDIEALRIGLGLKKIFVIGQAQGAEGALEYALRYPETTRGIVAAATYRGANAEPDFVALREQLAPPGKFKGRTGTQMRLSAHYINTNPNGVARFEAIDALNTNRQVVSAKLDEKRLVAESQSAGVPLNYEALGKINVPTLILSAERDDITPPDLMSALARNIPGAQYETVPDAGRYAFWENPDKFNETVLTFLREVVLDP